MKKILIPIIIILIIALGGWYLASKNNTSPGEVIDNGDIVATINKDKISRSEFESAQAQFIEAQNIDVSSLDATTKSQLTTQVLDILISQKLLQQAIDKSRTKATEKEISAQIEIIQSQFEDEKTYQAALVEQGVTEETLAEQITNDIITQKFLNKELDLESVTATEEEINLAYEQSDSESDNKPALKEIYDQVENFVIQQKQQNLISEFILKLSEKADIEILI